MRNTLIVIVSLIVILITCCQIGNGQTSNSTVVGGFNSEDNVGKITFFDTNNLNVIKKLEFKNSLVGELKVFKNANVERIFVGGGFGTGLAVIDLKTGQIIAKLLTGNAIGTIEADSKNIYVVNGVSVLFIIDAETLEIKKKVNLSSSSREVGDVVALKHGILILRLFFTDSKKNLLRISTMDSNSVETVVGETKVNFRLGFGNMGTAISADEKKIYIPSRGRVTEINLATGKKISFKTDIEFSVVSLSLRDENEYR